MHWLAPGRKIEEGGGSKIADVVYFDDEVRLNIVAMKEVGVGVDSKDVLWKRKEPTVQWIERRCKYINIRSKVDSKSIKEDCVL